jgi:2-dehydropantoate 2-reductase
MKVLVVGCGAIGSVYAARLSKVSDITAFDTWQEHVDAINRSGLKLTHHGVDSTHPVKAVSRPSDLPLRFDYAIVAVKSIHTREAILPARESLKGSVVLSVQNGIGNEEIIAEEAEAAVCQGVTMHGAELAGPGHALHLYDAETWMGPFRSTLGQARSFGSLMDEAGLKTNVEEDPRGAIWSKLIFQSVLAPLTVLVGGARTNIFVDPHVRGLAEEAIREGRMVAERLGIKLLFDPMASIEQVVSMGAQHRGSMQHDIEKRNRTEIEVTSGAIVRKAREVGLEVPRLETFYQLVKGMEFNLGIE